jgi:drug/metabolite transporter (DMT)-like permease
MIAFTGVGGTASERVGRVGTIGLLIGFAGVVLLVAGDAGGNGIAGDLMILGCTLSYAAGGLYARRLAARGIPPLAGPLGVGLMGGLVCLPGMLVELGGGSGGLDLTALGAIAALGLGCTGIAFVIFFELNRQWGAARAATVTYLIPVVGVTLGVLFNAETIAVAQVGGLVLILAGVVVAHGRIPGRARPPAVDALAHADGPG